MSEQLTGNELAARAAELKIEGRGTMTADEKRAAIADAEKAAASSKAEKPKTKKQAASASPLTWLGDITDSRPATRVLVAQALLRERGYQVGALDGAWGKETRRAISAFRADIDLPEGDTIDADVWAALACTEVDDQG